MVAEGAPVSEARGAEARDRPLDLICLGRAAADFYGEQIGSPLEDMSTFTLSLGGSAANIAVCAARQGLRVAMLTRVGDEHIGRFVRKSLAREGVDVSHVKTDPTRLTGLVVLGIRDPSTFPLIFFRERCADMGLELSDFDEAFIGSAKALLVNGTDFSEPAMDAVSRQAMAYARARGTKVVLDIDYRPVLWGLTGHGRGEDRFLESARVTAHLRSIIARCDLIVGTEEEIHIAGGSTDTLEALRAIRQASSATLVLKRGEKGAVLFEGPIPDRVEEGLVAPAFPITVLNVLGAGDAFLGGFLRGWIPGEPLLQSARYAAAAGALVVSRHDCSEAMPTRRELDSYLSRRDHPLRIDQDPEVKRIHRADTRLARADQIGVLAFDHRAQLEALAARAGASVTALPKLKALLAQSVLKASATGAAASFGAIADDQYGTAALFQLTGRGLFLARAIEEAGVEPVSFVGGPNVAVTLRSWPREQVIKCLVRYHPADDGARRQEIERRLELLQSSAHHTGHELLLEVIPEHAGRLEPSAILPAVQALYAAGLVPDWWKLPPLPGPAAWAELDALIARSDSACRGVLILGLDAPETELYAAFREAAASTTARGFAVGRTLFAAPAEAWLAGRIDDQSLIDDVADRFLRARAAWSERKGTP